MIDLDLAELKRIAHDVTRHGMHDGQPCCAVPLKLLQRVVDAFDCSHVADAMKSRFGR